MQASNHVQEWGYRHQVHLDNSDTHLNHRADKTQVIVLVKQPAVLSLVCINANELPLIRNCYYQR